VLWSSFASRSPSWIAVEVGESLPFLEQFAGFVDEPARQIVEDEGHGMATSAGEHAGRLTGQPEFEVPDIVRDQEV